MTDVIFCGNPGVGKSTLLSSISGCTFKSGLSFGGGLTSELKFQRSPHDRWKAGDYRFGDTPGLADIGMAEQAARAITQALEGAVENKRGVKIFFVVTTEGGRVRTDDLFTIKQVMGSIKLSDGQSPGPNSYGVLINKCTFLETSIFQEGGQKLIEAAFSQSSEAVPFATRIIKFLPMSPSLNDAENAEATFEGLSEYILAIPGIKAIAKAHKIDVSDMETKLKEQKGMHKKEMDDLERRLGSKHKAELDAVESKMNAVRDDLQEKIAASGGGPMAFIGDMVAKIVEQSPAVQLAKLVAPVVAPLGAVVANAVVKDCTIVNDTPYSIFIIDHDGTRELKPGQRQYNHIVRGGFTIDLKLVVSNTDEQTLNFDKYDGTDQSMSLFFKDKLAEVFASKNPDVVEITFLGYKKIQAIPAGKEVYVNTGFKTDETHTTETTTTEKVSLEAGVSVPVQGLTLTGGAKWENEVKNVESSVRSISFTRTEDVKWAAEPINRDIYSIVIEGTYTSPPNKKGKHFSYTHPEMCKAYTEEESKRAPPTLTLQELKTLQL